MAAEHDQLAEQWNEVGRIAQAFNAESEAAARLYAAIREMSIPEIEGYFRQNPLSGRLVTFLLLAAHKFDRLRVSEENRQRIKNAQPAGAKAVRDAAAVRHADWVRIARGIWKVHPYETVDSVVFKVRGESSYKGCFDTIKNVIKGLKAKIKAENPA